MTLLRSTPAAKLLLHRSAVLVVVLWSTSATAQAPKPAPAAPEVKSPATAPKPAAAPKPPPPKPQTDWEKGSALAKKHVWDQACPLLEKATHTTADSAALWNELGQCEWHRGHRKQAVEASLRSIVLGDRSQRKTAYETLHGAGNKLELPEKGCEWLPETPGTCEEQMWACGYSWQQNGGPQHKVGGHALTFGSADDERDVLEQALRDNTALRDQLAVEWKALMNEASDEKVCATCHAQATDSADGLVTAKASACFQQKMNRPAPGNICVESDADCEAFSACLDEASALAHRAEASRVVWPEAADVISAAHKVCDATCGVVSKTTCDVLGLDPCRGLVGYACVKSGRGKRPQVTLGEISVDDAKSSWSEVQQPPPPTSPASPPSGHTGLPAPQLPNHGGGSTTPAPTHPSPSGDAGAQAVKHGK